jgi:membrane protein YdbS with pleckstrin-like domain
VIGLPIVAVLVWLACPVACAAIAYMRGGNPVAWFTAGIVIGPLGILLALWMTRDDLPEGFDAD